MIDLSQLAADLQNLLKIHGDRKVIVDGLGEDISIRHLEIGQVHPLAETAAGQEVVVLMLQKGDKPYLGIS